jgi:saccharopine dehydrogenase (NAD+, L-glutamate forming)
MSAGSGIWADDESLLPLEPMSRSFDLVLFGATGFTGRLAAEYLARKGELPPSRWAIAGRSAAKLHEVRSHLATLDSRLETLAIIEASSDDAGSLRAMARSTKVVATTVGPYAIHGIPLVSACVAEGTHVCDITGEPEFVAETVTRFDDAARSGGVAVVSTCGFDSVPHDLGAWLAVRALPRTDEPTVVEGLVWAKGDFSGGTWQSAVNAMARLLETRAAVAKSRKPPQAGRKVGSEKRGLHFERRADAWAVPLPTIDPAVVLRSAAELSEYGSSFRYGHFARVKSLATVAGAGMLLGGVAALAQVPVTRRWLLDRRGSGEGPSTERRARHRFEVRFFGQRGSARSEVVVSGKDPGYDETAKMLAEAALCLALDDAKRPARSGVLTPVLALGDAYLARLRHAGIVFEVREGRVPWAERAARAGDGAAREAQPPA